VRIPSIWDRDDFGESEQPFALPTQRMRPFEPHEGSRGERRLGEYRRVTAELVTALVARSAGRVEDSEAFDEVRTKLAEVDAQEDRVRLAELLEKQEQESATSMTEPAAGDAAIRPPEAPAADDDPEAEDELSVQAEEALDILADLAVLSG